MNFPIKFTSIKPGERKSNSLWQEKYFPSLDGLRAISVTLVILGHAKIGTNFGGFGVKIFFVISGFLITSLLLKERERTGTLNLKAFYIRRFLRILPVAYLFLFTVLLLKPLFHLDIPNKFFFIAAFFLTNFLQGASYIGHFWSLATEEQFYLIFPYFLKKNLKTYTLFLLIFLGFLIILDFFNLNAYAFPKGSLLRIGVFLLIPLRNFDGIIMGSLAGLFLYHYKIDWETKSFPLFKWVSFLVLLPLALILYRTNLSTIPGQFYQPPIFGVLEVFILAILILLSLIPSKDIWFQILNLNWLKRIGVLSYSLYIWQQIFIRDIPWKNAFPWGNSLYFNLPALILVSLLSYYGFEKRFLKLKAGFEVK